MKKSIMILVLLFSVISGYPQITWEGRFDSNLKTFQLEDGAIKYLLIDHKENKLILFNSDNTIWDSVKLIIPKGHMIDEVELINAYDSPIKILFTCYYYEFQDIEGYDESFDDIVYTLNVLDLDGVSLLKIPKIDQYKLLSSVDQSMLMVYSSEESGFRSKQSVDIYSFSNNGNK